MSKVWLITGCTSGFGQEIALAALARGDTVVATARVPSRLTDLEAKGAILSKLDVTASDAELAETVSTVLSKTGGKLDIVVNNAGYMLTGGVEETSRAEVEQQFATNAFGQLNVIRAVLPTMRKQRSGVVANIGSVAGWLGFPAVGVYCASKACSTILAEALRAEVAPLGITVTDIEPGYFRTSIMTGGRMPETDKKIEDVAGVVEPAKQYIKDLDGNQPGDPRKAGKVIVELLTGTGCAAGKELPGRLLLGSDAYTNITGFIDAQRASIEQWKDVTKLTDF